MKRALYGILALVLAGLVIYVLIVRLASRFDTQTRQFHDEAAELISGLQEYYKFVGNYPTGSALEIANALSGQSESNKKVLIVSSSTRRKNERGELIDSWGTPIQFFFSHNSVLIRSAGPNRKFDDSGVPGADDLIFTDAK